MTTYDLSSLTTLENVVAQMVRDQVSGAFDFAGGSQPGAVAVAGGAVTGTTTAGRFTATYGNMQTTTLRDTAIALRNRLNALRLVVETLPF